MLVMGFPSETYFVSLSIRQANEIEILTVSEMKYKGLVHGNSHPGYWQH